MSNLWTLVLAGGAGRRLAGEAHRHYGYARPKQFCDFDGNGTLLSRTLRRARALSGEKRIAVVTTRAYRREALESLPEVRRPLLVEQPGERGTGPGILLPLLTLHQRDPRATVAVMPSDHHIADDEAFTRQLGEAVQQARAVPDRVQLVGTAVEETEDGYGWIVPRHRDRRHSPVERFREKPSAAEALQLRQEGALANTFVMVASLEALLRLCEWWMPQWWRALDGATDAPAKVAAAYATTPGVEFSRDVLEPAVGHLDLFRLDPVGWSDVGTPERLQRALGERVATPTSRLAAAARSSCTARSGASW